MVHFSFHIQVLSCLTELVFYLVNRLLADLCAVKSFVVPPVSSESVENLLIGKSQLAFVNLVFHSSGFFMANLAQAMI